ncbi:MAG: hypothetical protein AAFY60_15010, partial [Myxococcota bacterium]
MLAWALLGSVAGCTLERVDQSARIVENPYVAEVLTDTPRLYFSFDSLSDRVLNDAGGARSAAVLTGASQLGGLPAVSTGAALSLNDGGRFEIPGAAELLRDGGTLEFWIAPQERPAMPTPVVSIGARTLVSVTPELTLQILNQEAESSEIGRWSHLAFAWNASGLSARLNGAPVFEGTQEGAISGALVFEGLRLDLDDVALFERAVSATRLRERSGFLSEDVECPELEATQAIEFDDMGGQVQGAVFDGGEQPAITVRGAQDVVIERVRVRNTSAPAIVIDTSA